MTKRYMAGIEPDKISGRLSYIALQFLLDATEPDGRVHNRMNFLGEWIDTPDIEDAWGRTVMAYGYAATHHPNPAIRTLALTGYNTVIHQMSHHPRAMMFASLGAAEILTHSNPEHILSRNIMIHTMHMFGSTLTPEWVWTGPYLSYANATIPQTIITIGGTLNHIATTDKGLRMLEWLLARETRRGHLSVAGQHGTHQSDHADRKPQYDQQPIEVAAMADACLTAYTIIQDEKWLEGIRHTVAWFNGDNDLHECMYIPSTGAAYDGLHADRVNLNQGAESTLALHTTYYAAAQAVTQETAIQT
jgi:hypothetical protein